MDNHIETLKAHAINFKLGQEKVTQTIAIYSALSIMATIIAIALTGIFFASEDGGSSAPIALTFLSVFALGFIGYKKTKSIDDKFIQPAINAFANASDGDVEKLNMNIQAIKDKVAS